MVDEPFIRENEKQLRVSEIYASVQGEGPRTGMGTVFLRFGGCNLRCPGWPCDTLYAVDPAYRDEWRKASGSDILDEVTRTCRELNIENVCLTGGEPFLQPKRDLRHIVTGLLDADIQVEAFSNGQIMYPEWTFEKVNFIMDWKLPGSGNAADRTPGLLRMMERNVRMLKPSDAIKLVIKDEEDFRYAINVWEQQEPYTLAQWWAGIVWDNGNITEAELVDMIQDEGLPWHLNVQTHKYLWAPTKRGV